MFLAFDTETTALPKNYKAPLTDFSNWPRIVQIAWALYEEDGREMAAEEVTIFPDDFEISKEAAEVHGITTEKAREIGQPGPALLQRLHPLFLDAPRLLGHNVQFDRKVLGSEFLRLGLPDPLVDKDFRCTMMETVRIVNLPRLKWPKLQELHQYVFGKEFEDAHSALADVRACGRCFFELRRRKKLL